MSTRLLTRADAAGTTGSRSSRRGPARPAGRVHRNRWYTPWLFLSVFLVFFATFTLWPAIWGIWISLHDWDLMLPGKPWVGLQNYINLFTPDSRDFADFWQSMGATGIFTVLSVPVMVVLPLVIAVLFNRKFRGRAVFRALIFTPYVLGIAVIGLLWRNQLDAQLGSVNVVLGYFGIPKVPWLEQMPWTWIALVLVTVWWTMGFNAIIYLAGLQNIGRELYEAASLDGASGWQQFWHVTLPGLRAVLTFVVTLTILGAANMFGQSYVITNGGPGTSTRTVIMYIAQTGITGSRMGAAAAMGYFLAVILLLISILNFRVTRERKTR